MSCDRATDATSPRKQDLYFTLDFQTLQNLLEIIIFISICLAFERPSGNATMAHLGPSHFFQLDIEQWPSADVVKFSVKRLVTIYPYE